VLPRWSQKPRSRWAHGLFVTLLLVSFASAASADVEVVVIVNESSAIEKITLSELRLLYDLYRRSWRGGVRVVLILPKEGSSAMTFLSREIFRGRGSREIVDHYRTAAFQHRIAVLPQIADDRQAIALVRSEPGAIALIERKQAAEPGVRILEIQPN
jgi:hypothetical protein